LDFEYNTFSSRSFERFSQALAMNVLGNGILVFGDGPDGGREATFEGNLDFPSGKDPWSGYVVMQAKFLQAPGAPSEQADWVCDQLREELRKFLPPSNLRSPEYYILVTNAKLSPMPTTKGKAGKARKGGLVKVDEVFSEFKSEIGIKDYRIWHKDQISTFLQNAPGLRKTYAAWLCTSDIISNLLEHQTARSEAVTDAMFRYVGRELRSHQPIRLQQAGHSGDSQIMIEDVFTDLPFKSADQVENERAGRLLQSLLQRSRDCLDQLSVKAQCGLQSGRPERILLLGGPGQGKSTLSQFMAQVARASILRTERSNNIPNDISQIANRTISAARKINLTVELPRRFPLRVELPSLADSMAKSDGEIPNSLIDYVRGHINRVSNSDLTNDDLRRWINNYPTLIILDGLDEVPPSANRDSVIKAISEFWDEAPSADLLMVVTTRPQGYNDDLDPNLYTKWEMSPLSADEAIAYGTKLAEQKLADHLQRDRVLSRLKSAAHNSMTARLMVSPLQVAILLALIDQRGDAPTDRWSLFDKYFGVVLEREQGKAGAVGETMRRWARAITALHHKAGFLLQVDAEEKGSSEAYLDGEELKTLIRDHLLEEGFEGEELDRTSEELRAASTDRLVLIVQRQEGRFSFEVRSLQEFMAAAFLMTGRESVIQERLSLIVNRSHWRHAFLIAASKCFSMTDSQHYRDTIVRICSEINSHGSEIDQILRTGSQVALSLLDDGLVDDQPRYRKLLLDIALHQIEGGVHAISESLVKQSNFDVGQSQQFVSSKILSGHRSSSEGAKAFILRAAADHQEWALEKTKELWPSGGQAGAEIVGFPMRRLTEGPLYEHLRDVISGARPVDVIDAFRNSHHMSGRGLDQLGEALPFLSLLRQRRPRLDIQFRVGSGDCPLSMNVVGIDLDNEQSEAYDDLPASSSWQALKKVREFQTQPSEVSLANALEVSANQWPFFKEISGVLPWPVASILVVAEDEDAVMECVSRARLGEYGGADDWRKAEQRWREKGIASADICQWENGEFFDSRIAEVGAPFGSFSVTHGKFEGTWLKQLMNHLGKAYGAPQAMLAHALQFALDRKTSSHKLSADDLIFLFDEKKSRVARVFFLGSIILADEEVISDPKVLSVLDRLGKEHVLFHSDYHSRVPKVAGVLAEHANKYHGLVPIVSTLVRNKSNYDEVRDIFDDETLIECVESEYIEVRSAALILLALKGDYFISDELRSEFESCIENKRLQILLRSYLEADAMPRTEGLRLAESLSRILLGRPDLRQDSFIVQLQSCADRRSANLRDRGTWGRLELGESLFTHANRREVAA